jgi:signal transduction histidine kinase
MHPAGEFSSMVAAECVVLRVTDTGCGMDWATRARLGEPFFSTKGHEAAGLGLAMAYAVVKQAGGTVGCESEVGQGTCLTIWLPRVTDSVAAHEPAADPDARAMSHEDERVLV